MSESMRVLALVLLLAVAGAARGKGDAAKAQSAPQRGKAAAAEQPTVDQILDKYVQAVGTAEAFDRLKTRVRKGKVEISAGGASIRGEVEDYAKAPNKRLFVMRLAGVGVSEEGYDGKVGWTREPLNGLRERAGSELAAAALDSEFNRETKLKQLYQKLTLSGTEKVNGSEAYVIVATPSGSQPEKLYFDRQSGLLVRTDVVRENPEEGGVPFTIVFEDYREVDHVKFPFVERQTAPGFAAVIRYDSIEHNVPLDDSKFNKPASK